MTLKRVIPAILTAMALSGATAHAQVANYALELSAGGSVDCGPMAELNGKKAYTIQFWMNPSKWTADATLLSRGNSLAVTLGKSEGSIAIATGSKQLEAKSADLKAGAWTFVSVFNDGSKARIEINGKEVATGSLAEIAETTDNFTIGGNYTGRIDEVRIFGALFDQADFNQLRHTTMHPFSPQWDDLVAYYKMDMNECADLVDYKSIETPDAPLNNHGIMSKTGAKLTRVTDNDALPYLINSAYTANERFYDRAIPREQYLLSNDLIILGVESLPDGHVRVISPNNHAVPSGGVKYLAEFEGRKGVASFDGTGCLTAPERTLEFALEGDSPAYTFETWFYVDQWVKDAYLFRKESDDGKQGFSVRLGDEGQLFVRCNGSNYGAKLDVQTGKWHHIGIVPRNTGVKRTTYLFVFDGTGKSATASLCDDATDCTPQGTASLKATLGENFKGKLDETVIWNSNYDAQGVISHKNNVQMPGFDIVLTSQNIQRANTAWLYDKADNIGWDYYSQDHWRDIMTEAYRGYRGYQVRISVKSHNNWQSTIGTEARRKIFAKDLGEIAKDYDGVELDLEWMDGKQTNLGHLAREIRACLPAGKSLFISCHAYGAYQFPINDMQYVDGFTFQQYGPQKTFFSWSNYTSSTQAFINYGFDRKKIMTSYGTTTSRGYKGNETVTEVSGVRAGFFDAAGFNPNNDSGDLGGNTYYFTGPMQTYKRAKYCVDNGLQGIFYWDMGNDMPVNHPYNLAKWASWGISPNVDRDIKSVDVRHSNSGVGAVKVDTSTASDLNVTVEAGGSYLAFDRPVTGNCAFYTPAGARVAATKVAGSHVDIDSLHTGVYVLVVTEPSGVSHSARFIKK